MFDAWLESNENWKKDHPENNCCKVYGCLLYAISKGYCLNHKNERNRESQN